MESTQSLATEARVALVRRRLNVSALARQLGMSRGHLSSVLSGRLHASERLIHEIAKYLGRSIATRLAHRRDMTPVTSSRSIHSASPRRGRV